MYFESSLFRNAEGLPALTARKWHSCYSNTFAFYCNLKQKVTEWEITKMELGNEMEIL